MRERPSYANAISEALFIILPFIILVIFKTMQGDFLDVVYRSDFSLAISIMYGQLLARTLSVPDNVKKGDAFRLFQVVVFIISLLSITVYSGFQMLEGVSTLFYYFQFFIFIVGVIFYIPILTLLNNKSNIAKK
tara:strand:+ start:386 stop:787 length:402 start_codon:yes stop_codon:yes gene_type:complete